MFSRKRGFLLHVQVAINKLSRQNFDVTFVKMGIAQNFPNAHTIVAGHLRKTLFAWFSAAFSVPSCRNFLLHRFLCFRNVVL